MTSPNQVVRAAGLLMGISVLSRLAGFIREQAIAYQFGTSMETDAYVVAYTIVNVLYLVLGGALATVFIPVFTSRLTEERISAADQPAVSGSAWRFASTVFNLAALVLGIISLLGMSFSSELVSIIVPNFTPEAAELTAQLTRIMFPIALFAALSMLVGGILNSLQHFTLPALSSVVFSLTVTAAVFTLADPLTWGVKGLALGTVIATLLQVLVQVPALRAKGMRYFFRLDFRQEGVKQVGRLVGPVILGTTVQQAYIVIERFLASGLAVGSISALNFANKLMFLPFNLFAMAINVAIFPTLSEHAANNDRLALGRTTALGLKLIGLLTIPATVGMLVLSGPLVRLVYQRGAFDLQSANMTTSALYFYLLGLFALGGYNVFYRAFYALQDTRTPVAISIFSVLSNLILGLILVGPLKHAGLALAVALAANLNLLLAYLFLRPRLPGLSLRELAPPLGKMLLVSTAMGVIVWLTWHGSGYLLSAGGTREVIRLSYQLLQVGVAVTVGLVFYLWGIKVVRADEETLSLAERWVGEVFKRFRNKGR